MLDQRPPTSDLNTAMRTLRVNDANLALGHEVFEAAGATFVRDTRFPDIHDANHVTHGTASTPDEIDSVLERVEREYTHCRHRKFHTDFTTPPQQKLPPRRTHLAATAPKKPTRPGGSRTSGW